MSSGLSTSNDCFSLDNVPYGVASNWLGPWLGPSRPAARCGVFTIFREAFLREEAIRDISNWDIVSQRNIEAKLFQRKQEDTTLWISFAIEGGKYMENKILHVFPRQ